MKKKYKTADVDHAEYSAAASGNTGSSAVERPLLKLGEKNARYLKGTFSLPKTKECQEPTLEVAYRILGFALSRDMLAHMPADKVTADMIGQLFAFYPFSYHKRFGETYTDYVCPASTRTCKCPICTGRIELFGSDAYRVHKSITKDHILDANFGEKQIGMFFAHVFFNGEDYGIRAVTVPLTNPKAQNAKHDNFFDLIAAAATPKKLLASESLPHDYYANGDGARWIIAEYTRATFADANENRKGPPATYWKLSKITPTKELPGLGKAKDIWWPEVDGVDGAEGIDVYDMINHMPNEELAIIAEKAVNAVFNPRKRSEAPGEEGADRTKTSEASPSAPVDRGPAPTWEEIVEMDGDELVQLGIRFGGDEESLTLVGQSNESALRRAVAAQCGVKPRPIKQTADEGSGNYLAF